MNIFILSTNPVKAARYQLDKHVVKMPLETAQLLCSPFEPGTAPYKRTHYNHPCSKWVREAKENYLWTIEHGIALSEEYTRRYGKRHKSQDVIGWCARNMELLEFPKEKRTPFAKAMPEEYITRNAVTSYRTYYINDKKDIATWKYSKKPSWWV